MSAVVLPQGKAWVEREEMRAVKEREVEVAQEGKAADTSTEAASGLRGEAVGFGETRKQRQNAVLSRHFTASIEERREKGKPEGSPCPLISDHLVLLIKKMSSL